MGKFTKFEITVSEDYTRKEREAIGQEAVDRIRARTQDGHTNKDGKKLPSYSKEYVDSLNFKNAGKSASEVNFTLSGDTISALDVLSTAPGKIVIGWEDGSPEEPIAEGNIIGSYGRSPNPKKARNILGLTTKELNEILLEFPLDAPDEMDAKIQEYLLSKEASGG